ncbi:MAG: hypothetical protein HUK17_01335 [Bacteroidales bacterium]|nr:hypothetical protein [Bacteroidales bacterium]
MDQAKAYRSTLRGLRIMLIISIVGSGYALFSNLSMGLLYRPMQAIYESGEWKNMIPLMSQLFSVDDVSLLEASMEQTMAVPRVVYLLWGLLYGMSLAGVIMMLRVNRNGFHFYAIAQLLVLIVTILFLGKSHLNVGDIMLTILFIFYYFTTFRRLDALRPTPDTDTADSDPS